MHGHGTRRLLVNHITTLERLEDEKAAIVGEIKDTLETAKAQGFDPATLKAVLKLRKMTPEQRRERRALELIYLAALGILDGEPLSDEARRRLAGEQPKPSSPKPDNPNAPPLEPQDALLPPPIEPPAPMAQPTLGLKDPAEAREEGVAAAAAGQRIYDNPYPAGDPCRAAWDEGWCSATNSHGMDVPAAYQRRQDPKPPKKDDDGKGNGKPDAGAGEDQAAA
jgi:uncharacterized protein (UPF0335 family)